MNSDIDPYTVEDHLTYEDYWALGTEDEDDFQGYEGCPEIIWENESEGILIDGGEIAARNCPACTHKYEMWLRIIEDTGHVKYGNLAFYAINLDADVEVYPDLVKSLPAYDHELLKILRQERHKYERSRTQQMSSRSASVNMGSEDIDE